MQLMKQIWRYILAEPFTWIFYRFFQPAKFKREYEREGSLTRIIPMSRLALPMFLVSYSFSLILWLILYKALAALDLAGLSFKEVFVTVPSFSSFLLATAWSAFLGVLFGIMLGIAWDIGWGISSGIAAAIFAGTMWSVILSGIAGDAGVIVVSIAGSVAGGFAGSTTVRTTEHIFRNLAGSRGVIRLILTGMVGGVVGGIASGVVVLVMVSGPSNTIRGATWGMAIGTAMSIGRCIGDYIRGNKEKNLGESKVVSLLLDSLALGIVAGILADIGTGILISITRNISGSTGIAVSGNIAVGIMGGFAVGIIVSIGIVRSSKLLESVALTILMAIVGAILLTITLMFIESPSGSIVAGIAGGVTFIISYIPGYHRLPLYPVSGFSSLLAYLASRKNPLQVFTHLHHSSLYWDEYVYLPLPGLKESLLNGAMHLWIW